MSSTVLSDLDINTTAPQPTNTMSDSDSTSNTLNKPKSMDYHRQVLQSRLEEDKGKQTYISPSDTIQSPCTQKLSAFKEKRFMKAKPQSLFAKKSAKSFLANSNASDDGASLEGKGTNPFAPSNTNGNVNEVKGEERGAKTEEK